MKYTFVFLIFLILLAPGAGHAQWMPTNSSIYGDVTTLTTLGDNPLCGTIMGDVFHTTDNGANWNKAASGLRFDDPSFSVNAFTINGANIFAACDGLGVLLSSDSGINWTQVNSKSFTGTVVAFASSGTNLFAGTTYLRDDNSYLSGIFQSTDRGANWSPASTGLPLSWPGPLYALTTIGTDLFVVLNSITYRSTNYGTSWDSIRKGYVQCFGVMDSTIFAGESGVVRSTDRGKSWVSVNNGLPANAQVFNFAVRDSMLFAAVDLWDSTNVTGHVYLSTDRGSNWINEDSGLPKDGILSLTITSTYVFAGTSNQGVWRRSLVDLLGLASVKEGPTRPESSPQLSQAVDRLTAEFPGNFEIQILNLLGAEVLSKRGAATLDLDLSSLPAGVYFAIVQAGDAREVKRIAVVH